MTLSSHKRVLGITGANGAGSVTVTDTDAIQSTVVTITCGNGIVITLTEAATTTSTDTNSPTYEASTGSSGSKIDGAVVNIATALNANQNLTATGDADTNAVTITEVNGGAGGSIVFGGGSGGMTVVDITGGADALEDIDGGVLAHGGTISSSRWTNKTVGDLNKGADSYGSLVYDSSWVDKVVSTQNLAYNPNGHSFTRSLANSGFLARGVQTLIGGRAGTADFLNIVGSDYARQFIHGLETTRQHGTWSDTILDLFGTGALSGSRTGDGSSSSFINPLTAGGVTASTDSAANPTRAIPGEFVMLGGFVDWTTSSGSGDGTASVNLMDYSAITG